MARHLTAQVPMFMTCFAWEAFRSMVTGHAADLIWAFTHISGFALCCKALPVAYTGRVLLCLLAQS